MKALVQRADSARVEVDHQVVGAFEGPGLVVLVGVTHGDTEVVAQRLASKVYQMRIFDPDRFTDDDAAMCRLGPATRGRGELSAADLQLPVLVISQFTLYGSTAKGRRPSWEAAAPGPVAEPLVEAFADCLRTLGAEVPMGVFGADMRVSLTNDGPITLLVEV